MKKYKLLKQAYDKYSKETKFKNIATGEIIESSGNFDISEGDIFDEINMDIVYEEENKLWAEIVTGQTVVVEPSKKLKIAVNLYYGQTAIIRDEESEVDITDKNGTIVTLSTGDIYDIQDKIYKKEND